MITGEIHILPTDNTPEFHFSPDGIIKIRGRGLIGNKSEVTEQIGIWIDEYVTKPAEPIYVIIAFEDLNSFCTTILFSILKCDKDVCGLCRFGNVFINPNPYLFGNFRLISNQSPTSYLNNPIWAKMKLRSIVSR